MFSQDRRPILESKDILEAERLAYNSPIYIPNDMARKKKDSKGRENNITITASSGESVDTNADQLHELAESIQKKNRQSEMEGSGFDLPPEIQSINNAADELFDIADERTTIKERYAKAELSVMGMMRAAGRTIYKYRDRTIRLAGSEKLKIEAPKKPRVVKSKIGKED